MKRLPDGSLQFAPKDLITFLEGDFAAWCERLRAEGGDGSGAPAWFQPDESDAEDELIKRRGMEHERRVLELFKAQYPDWTEIERSDGDLDDTLAAMRAGRSLIYQAHLADGAWHGLADFLLREPAPSGLGDWAYWPVDSKLAHKAKPYFLIQLCAYADFLERAQGVRPAKLGFVLGDGTQKQFDTIRYFYFYRHLKRVFESFQRAWNPAQRPDPSLDRAHGRWTAAAQQLLEEADDLALVARITRSQIKRLRDAGVHTCADLVAREGTVPRVHAEVLERLRRQARLQRDSRGLSLPAFEVLPHEPAKRAGLAALPPAAPGDVYLDLEGFPLFGNGGLEYLFGAVTVDEGKPQFHDWWAHDEVEERAAFRQVVDWIHARWKQYPGMHVYHYANYEVNAFTRLMGKYATRENEVDDLLRGKVFVDLYAVTRHGVAIGTPSYSLKDIEVLFAPPRTSTVMDGSSSIVEYQAWIDSGQPREWQASPILAGIRQYNLEDCEYTWRLAEWLRTQQGEAGIAYLEPKDAQPPEEEREVRSEDELADTLLARATALPEGEPRRLLELAAWLLNYHRREAKPEWWWHFKRVALPDEELYDDAACLAGLTRTDTPLFKIKRSQGAEYRFDPDQETKLHSGDRVVIVPGEEEATLDTLDMERGIATLKIGPGKAVPERCSIIPGKPINDQWLRAALTRYAQGVLEGTADRYGAIADLLSRRPPRVLGTSGALLSSDAELPAALVDLVARLDATTLCIQGPPGTGKTYSAAAVIVALAAQGKRIGVCSNSHKAIMNLLLAVSKRARDEGRIIDIVKVQGSDDDPDERRVRYCDSDELPTQLGGDGIVAGATVYPWSRPECEQQLDYMFVDEAGQVPLANAIILGLAARNLVLIGDQMQLAQPVQGSHPGESGLSCFHYYLEGYDTVPPEFGVLLPVTWRMHPEICRFISDTAYEGRLTPQAVTSERCVVMPARARVVTRSTGIVLHELDHEGDTYSSETEAAHIVAIVAELRGAQVEEHGTRRPFDVRDDLLIVAPYNAQVRLLKDKLGEHVRIASVDKFQGQEATVVIVSMCASTLEETPRGMGFLLSPNRLNVAISRAKCLAIVAASNRLIRTRPNSVKEIELLNLYCWLREYAAAGTMAATV